ncbi:MAG: hypothetical protein K6E20_00145 [Acholeplasmatales bacterium]|nr:hypothetical protein [Acholeplasmatales bacterium]
MNDKEKDYILISDKYLEVSNQISTYIELANQSINNDSLVKTTNLLQKTIEKNNFYSIYKNINVSTNNSIKTIMAFLDNIELTSFNNKIEIASFNQIGKILINYNKAISENSKKWYLNVINTYSKQIESLQSALKQFGYNESFNQLLESINVDNKDVISRDTAHSLKYSTVEEMDESYTNTITVKIKDCATGILNHLTQIASMDNDIFVTTPKVFTNIGVISSTVCKNEEDFSRVAIAFYELIYEGTKSYSSKIKEYVPFDEAPIIKTIKYLRKDFAHDIYAESDFQKKNKQIEDTYMGLIKKRRPIVPRDFKELQFKLYSLVNEFLELLADKISRSYDVEK